MSDDGFFSPLDMHAAEREVGQALTVVQLVLGLAGCVAAVSPVLLVAHEIERRGRPAVVVAPRLLPPCARLAVNTGRVDLVTIDHVLVYRCGRT